MELRDITLNCRYVYVPPHQVPDKERKFGNLTLTYATQIHACVIEIDEETGAYEIVDYGAVDDCGKRINPQIVEGQVHGATAHAIGGATHEHFPYDEQGNLLTPNFYDYHVPHAMDMPPLKTDYVESPSPFTPLGAKGMGEGGGAGLWRSAPRSRTRCAARRPIVYDSCNPYWRVWELHARSGHARENVTVERDEGRGDALVRAPREVGLERAQRPGADGADDAERRSRSRSRTTALERERGGAARARLAEDVDRSSTRPRSARPSTRRLMAKGDGRRRDAADGDAVRARRGAAART